MKNYKLKKRRQFRHLFFVFMIKLLFQLVLGFPVIPNENTRLLQKNA